MGKRGDDGIICLGRAELERLTDTWTVWAESAPSPVKAITRLRLHLFFLLARYGGLRLSEIYSFSPLAALDRETGLLQTAGRRMFLPPVAMRSLRRILSLPEASGADFMKLDAGFVRKTFYARGRAAGLPPEACAPRALRYARCRELLELRTPPQVASRLLDIDPASESFARLKSMNKAECLANHLDAFLTAIQTDFHAGRLFFESAAGGRLQGIFPLDDLAELEPVIGSPVTIHILPELIFPSTMPLPMANCLKCQIISGAADTVESRFRLSSPEWGELLALPDTSVLNLADKTEGAWINVHIPASAIKIYSN